MPADAHVRDYGVLDGAVLADEKSRSLHANADYFVVLCQEELEADKAAQKSGDEVPAPLQEQLTEGLLHFGRELDRPAAAEDAGEVAKWLDSHGRKFGQFIGDGIRLVPVSVKSIGEVGPSARRSTTASSAPSTRS